MDAKLFFAMMMLMMMMTKRVSGDEDRKLEHISLLI